MFHAFAVAGKSFSAVATLNGAVKLGVCAATPVSRKKSASTYEQSHLLSISENILKCGMQDSFARFPFFDIVNF
jgi:hypothetical protein